MREPRHDFVAPLDHDPPTGSLLVELHTVGVGTGILMHSRGCSLEEATQILLDDAGRRGIEVVTLAALILQAGLD